MAFVAGEAGVGKTALLRAFCDSRAGMAQVLWGTCDGVAAVLPLAPFAQIAEQAGGGLRAAIEANDRDQLLEAAIKLLRAPRGASKVLVVEDLHWADDATLDLLRRIGRRIDRLPALLAATYREEEVGKGHALRAVMDAVPPGSGIRLRVPALSLVAVERLALGTALDAAALHAASGGNPFYVTEAVANPTEPVPSTVQRAVEARVRRLSRPAQRVVRAASILGQTVERRTLDGVIHPTRLEVAEAVEAGVLLSDGEWLAFRHALAQQAILATVGPTARRDLHRRALASLRGRTPTPDAAELTRHAAEAADGQAVVEYAPLAGERAASLGAHRQAAEHYRAALDWASLLPDVERALLLEAYGAECRITDRVAAAIDSLQQALELWRRLGDQRRLGDCLRALSDLYWLTGSGEALTTCIEAVTVLEGLPTPGLELARAYAALAQRYQNTGVFPEAVGAARRGLAIAESLGDEAVAAHARTTLGVCQLYSGQEGGRELLTRAARRAAAAGLFEDASRALINIVQRGRDDRDYALVDRYGAEAVALTEEHDLDLFRRILLVDLAEAVFERGRWLEAEHQLRALLREPDTAPLVRARAEAVLGRLLARRGDPGARDAIQRAASTAATADEAGELAMYVHLVSAESAWLTGDAGRAATEGKACLSSLEQLTTRSAAGEWEAAEIRFWAWKVGVLQYGPTDGPPPYRDHAAVRLREAAAAWERLGCPYQQGLALADSRDEHDLRRALVLFHRLGARPMAARVTKRLESIGAQHIARGPRPGTRSNPGGLTARQLDILSLLARGLRNAEIAEQLFLSPKTVDHHVSAVLRKLGATSRAEAVDKAARAGLVSRQRDAQIRESGVSSRP